MLAQLNSSHLHVGNQWFDCAAASTIYVTLDLDKPHQGLIKVSQSPMLNLREKLKSDGETKR